MRGFRASLLVLLLAVASAVVATIALDPLVNGWHAVVRVDQQPRSGAPAAHLVALLTGGFSLLLVLAWLWLASAMAACTWDAVRAGPADPPGRRSAFLRPPLVRAVVATCLGATALATPAAQGRSPGPGGEAPPDHRRPPAASVTAPTLRALDGLPVPDRVTAPVRSTGSDRVTSPVRATGRPRGRAVSPVRSRGSSPASRSLQVAAGDSLWSLTASLLPADASPGTVAAGWRLLYDANRAVVGPDPDLLQPGQRLRIDPALESLLRSSRRSDHPLDDPFDHYGQPLDHHAGGAR